ncbi:hypothetical protein GCM10007855_16350 [Aliivibrio sifiae]|uniref:L-cystine transporter n=1 Tax=Aliivibrio sifiae TaxID=566293 RepID=A0ABQ6AIX4_9GAMM|nr:hypothetical protein GCM10007855_16350 [Aliivibrio sifiae]
MSFTLIGLFIAFLGFYFLLFQLKKHKKSFNYRVLTALIGGLVFGSLIQLILGNGNSITGNFAEIISVFGSGYIKLLQMIVIPLVFVAMTASIMNVEGNGSLSKIAPKVIGVLIFTVAIAALIGIASIYLFIQY